MMKNPTQSLNIIPEEVLPVNCLRDHLFGIVDEIYHFCCVGHHGVLLERTPESCPSLIEYVSEISRLIHGFRSAAEKFSKILNVFWMDKDEHIVKNSGFN
jgi:hypothetical protein